jgi:hypothetical protein
MIVSNNTPRIMFGSAQRAPPNYKPEMDADNWRSIRLNNIDPDKVALLACGQM